MRTLNILDYLIIFLGITNLIRMTIFLVGSDLYNLRALLRKKRSISSLPYYPSLSVVIPAHNEEKTVLQAVKSVLNNNYPMARVEVVVVDDGSVDRTAQLVKDFKKRYNLENLKIVRQENSGKANALNNGMKN